MGSSSPRPQIAWTQTDGGLHPHIQLELCDFLRQTAVNLGWCTVFLQTVSKPAPASSMQGEPLERERHHWWKAKKWAYFNLNRLYIRYVGDKESAAF